MKVVLVDDHSIFREGLRTCLQTEPGIEIIGEASDGEAAVKMVCELLPDLVVLDIAMPKMNGIEAIRRLNEVLPSPPKFVVLSMYSDREFMAEALRHGVSGYITKSSAIDELRTAVRAISGGQAYFSPDLSNVISSIFTKPLPSHMDADVASLTNREREVLQLLVEGLNAKEIGQRLLISSKTVHAFRCKLMAKLNIDNVAELTKFAIRVGLTSYGK